MRNSVRRINLIIIALAVLFTVSIVLYELMSTVFVSDGDDIRVVLEDKIPGLMEKYDVPGVAAALVDEGEVYWVKGFGFADRKNKIPIDENTEFQVASNSKTLTAWGVMKLVEKGLIKLDDPVDKYLTRWHLPKSKYDNNQVTIRRILSHTAGLAQRAYAGYPQDYALPTLEESLSGKVNGVVPLTVKLKPGTKYKYSGGGYTLLQLLIEEVSGKPFSQYMEDEILKPLGMGNSSYEWREDIKKKTAKPYDALEQTMETYVYAEKAAAGLYTNARDFAGFVAANMDNKNGLPAGKNVIDKASLAEMQTPIKKDYGLGYIIKLLPDGEKLIYHGGTNRGWRSQFVILPDQKKGLVVLTNSENGENLHRDILSLWTKRETGSFPEFHRTDIIKRMLIRITALLLFLLIIRFAAMRIVDILNREKALSFIGIGTGGNTVRIVLIKCILPICISIMWMMLFYTGVFYNGWTFASFMPAGFKWITGDVILWSLISVLNGLFVKDLVTKNQNTNSSLKHI